MFQNRGGARTGGVNLFVDGFAGIDGASLKFHDFTAKKRRIVCAGVWHCQRWVLCGGGGRCRDWGGRGREALSFS